MDRRADRATVRNTRTHLIRSEYALETQVAPKDTTVACGLMRIPSLSQDIETIGVVVQELVDVEFSKAGKVVSGSALDQVGLSDGLGVVRDYLRHGELGVAFDHVLYMIRELDLAIPAETFVLLARAAEAMNVSEQQLKMLKIAPKDRTLSHPVSILTSVERQRPVHSRTD